MMKNFFSCSASCIILFAWMVGFFRISMWKSKPGVIRSDVISYYAYLPAAFIYHDITLKFVKEQKVKYWNKFWPLPADNGGLYIKTSMGLAMMYSPFFFGAHLYAKCTAEPANGFSHPYQVAILLSSIFYGITGLLFLKKTLSRYFNDAITGFTLFITALGTNLFAYVTIEAGMSHAYSFCLINIFLWLIVKWYERPAFKYALPLGLTLGLIILIRPTNILIGIVFILYGVTKWNDAVTNLTRFWRHKGHLAVAAAAIFLVWLPQLLYWKHATGHWLFFSYAGERFFFNQPHIIEGLFGYRKGWFLYTPVMAFAVAGLLMMRKKIPEYFTGTLVFITLFIYVTLSWWAWWYGGGFGLRAFIDIYGLMALPLASLISYICLKNYIQAIVVTTVMLLLTALQLFQSWQYYYGLIHWDGMTREAFRATFLNPHKPPGWENLLKLPDYDYIREHGKEPPDK